MINLSDLRLQIQTGTTGNRIINPDGDQGTWGWSGYWPTDSDIYTTNNASGEAWTYASNGFGTGNKLLMAQVGDGAYQEADSNYVPMTAGQYVGGQVLLSRSDLTLNPTLWGQGAWLFMDANGGYISMTNDTRQLLTDVADDTPVTYVIPTAVAPAGTAYVRMCVIVSKDASGTPPDHAAGIFFNNAMMLIGNTSVEVTGQPYVAARTYKDLLSPTSSINVKKSELEVGLLSARINDALLDPNLDPDMRPGADVRLQAYVNSEWVNVFVGRVTSLKTVYNQKGRPDITLSAADAISVFANSPQSGGVNTVAELPNLLALAGAPWHVNGKGNVSGQPSYTYFNPNASLLDQIAVIRDSDGAYAWVDNNGMMQVYKDTLMPVMNGAMNFTDQPDDSTPEWVSYTHMDAQRSTTGVINQVIIKRYENDVETGETVEVAYGPYVNQTSIDEWGANSVEINVVPSVTPSVFAAGVLANNAVPTIAPLKLSFAATTANNFDKAALIDLYTQVNIYREDSTSNVLVNDDYRVTAIEHNITPGLWTVDLTFKDTGAVASYNGNAPTITRSTLTGGGTVDTEPPPVAEQLTLYSRLGTITASWNGLGSAGEDMPADFDHAEIHRSTVNDFTPDSTTLVGTLRSAGLVVVADLVYGTTYYFKLVTVDNSENKSVGSVQASAAVTPLVDTDVIGQVIAGANIVDGSITASSKIVANSITSALIQANSISAGHIQTNAITADKISAGAITAAKINAYAIDGMTITGVNINSGRFTTNAGGTSRVDMGQVGYSTDEISLWNNYQVASIRNPDYPNDGALRVSLPGGLICDYINLGDNVYTMRTSGAQTISIPGPFKVGGLVTSNGIYNNTATFAANVGIASAPQGRLYRLTSSERYKVEIQPEVIPTDSIMALQPKSYVDKRQWEEAGNDSTGLVRHLGLIAEDVAEIPVLKDLLVTYNDEGQPDAVSYDRVAVTLIATVQDLYTKNKDLEARIVALESKG